MIKFINTEYKLLLILLLTSTGFTHAESIALVGGRLIDGTGNKPLIDSVVLIKNNQITAVGQQGKIKIPDNARVINTNGKTVMPGLIELHSHFELVGHGDYDHWYSQYPKRMEKEIFPAATKAILMAGVTSARDLGGDVERLFKLRDKVNSGKLLGPRLFIAGPFLRKQKGYFVSEQNKNTWRITDAEDGRKKVGQLVNMGVDVIKTQDDSFTVDEFKAIFEEAHRHGLQIAAHLYTTEGIRKALQAGLGEKDTIEHVGEDPSMAYPDDVVQMIIKQNVYMSPTAMARDGFRQIVENLELLDDPLWVNSLPHDIYLDIRQSFRGINLKQHSLYKRAFDRMPARTAKLQQLHKAGAQFVVGSDSGTRANPQHTSTWREMVLLVEQVGLSNMDVIVGTTRIAAGVLGMGDQLGTIEAGKLADIIVVNGDPLAHMSDMRLVDNVIKNGVIVR